MSLTDSFGNFLASAADFFKNMCADAVLFKEFGSTFGSLDVKAKVIESSYKFQSFFLVFICNGSKNSAVILKTHTRCLKCFVKRTV